MKKVPNQLIDEKSPYLLQHAYNPVNWYPWGKAAFEKAKLENKPIFLSIGYSTCHWCHVMENESFEDLEIAEILNRHFVSVKVDREERPDIDHIYMEVCQALTGSGGWPLSIFMTPEMKPFFAGTYFPKDNRYGRIGLKDLLEIIVLKWQDGQEEIITSANEITSLIRQNLNNLNPEKLDEYLIEKTFNTLEMSFDRTFGGFGHSPKFPAPHNLLFLLRYGIYHNSPKAIEMAEKTLIQMYKGGIFDHVGYGFSRYSTDNKWLIPHFEKMLYDNALLTLVYTECYQLTRKPIYKEVAEKIITFVLRELTSPEGAFYTAIYADSDGVEGKFYTWTLAELQEILDPTELMYLANYYDITPEGNFEGGNILNLINQADNNLQDHNSLVNIRNKLYESRWKRIHPRLDDKILTGNNALMIVALAKAGRVFENNEYINQAEKALNFIKTNLLTKDKRLLARFLDNEAKYQGYLDDCAYLIWALNELFLSTYKITHLELSLKLYEKVMLHFKDMVGGFYHTSQDSENLIMRIKPLDDAALPSGNSVMTMNLLQLSEITDDSCMAIKARNQFAYFSSRLNERPTAYTYMITTYMYYLKDKRKIVLVGNLDSPKLKRILKELNSHFLPFTTTVVLDKNSIETSDLFSEYGHNDQELALYVCENFHCNEPLYDEGEILKELQKIHD